MLIALVSIFLLLLRLCVIIAVVVGSDRFLYVSQQEVGMVHAIGNTATITDCNRGKLNMGASLF